MVQCLHTQRRLRAVWDKVRCRCVMCRTHIHLIFALFIFSTHAFARRLHPIPLVTTRMRARFDDAERISVCLCVCVYDPLRQKEKSHLMLLTEKETPTDVYTQRTNNTRKKKRATVLINLPSRCCRHRCRCASDAMHVWSVEQKTLTPIYYFYLLTINRFSTNIYPKGSVIACTLCVYNTNTG